jgi:hypothetical protein
MASKPTTQDSAPVEKPTKSRSPNHPVLSLQVALERAEILQKPYGTNPLSLTNFCKAFKYGVNSSGSIQLLASLGAYGLVSVAGVKDDRKISVTPMADRIVRDAPDRKDLVKKAALMPEIHKELWQKYEPQGGLPHDDILKQYLIWERPGVKFTEDAANGFIERFRSTLDFAGITSKDKLDDEPPPKRAAVDDFVQWTSNGVEQFTTPLRVRQISEDGEWALLEGSDTGVPMSELAVIDPPKEETGSNKSRSENPFTGKSREADGLPPITFPLPNGNSLELRIKKTVTKKDWDRIVKLVALSEGSFVVDE